MLPKVVDCVVCPDHESRSWGWRVDERCVVPVRAFVTGLESWTERDEVRNGLGVDLAKLLDVMQLE